MSGLVIVLRALPGSGKSTFGKRLADKAKEEGKSVEICSADEFFYNLGGGKYRFEPSKISEAHKYCFKKYMNALNNNVDVVIVDNTNLSAFEISPYKMVAESHDYDFKIHQVNVSPDVAFKRQQHGVSQRGYEAMNDRFKNEFIPPWWEKEEFDSTSDEEGSPDFQPSKKPERSKQLSLPFEDKKANKLEDNLYKIARKMSKKY